MEQKQRVEWLEDKTKRHPEISKPYEPVKHVYGSSLEALGHTPMVRMVNIPKEAEIECEMLAKCEFLNMCGSLKDRIGFRMVEDAERLGVIKPGDKLVEATSGNTGIGLAMAAAVKGYQITITLPEKMSNQKVDVLKGLGAKIIRTPTEAAFDSPLSNIGVAKIMHEKGEAIFLNQYDNPSNPLAHYDQTAEEIIEQCEGKLDAFIISVGTGGSITGIGRKLKEKMPGCLVVGIDPYGSILAQPQSLNTPTCEPYKVEGIGYDFIPKVLDRSVVDKWVKTEDKSSFYWARKLISREGLLAGGSAGSTLFGAVSFIREMGWDKDKSKRVCILFSDSVRNYITKFLSKEWCVENKFIDYEEIAEKGSKLYKASLDKLELEQVAVHEKVTVGEAKALFKKGQKCIPVLTDSKLKSVIFPGKFLQIVLLRGLKDEDSAAPCATKDFVHVPQSIDLSALERMVQRHSVVLVGDVKAGHICWVSAQNFMNLV